MGKCCAHIIFICLYMMHTEWIYSMMVILMWYESFWFATLGVLFQNHHVWQSVFPLFPFMLMFVGWCISLHSHLFFGCKTGSFFRTQDVVPTIKAAVTESPWKLWWVGLLYAVQNLLYFVCLQYTSAAAYQVLSAMAGFNMLFFELKRISPKRKPKHM